MFAVTILPATVSAAIAAPSIELELATENGLQITAPQEWLQLLTRLGVENVQIRGAKPGDAPAVTNRGTAQRPRYHVVGILSSREQLRLPGDTFTRGDAKRLKDYFDRLSADGDERLTAPEGHFGLTQKELADVFADLSQPLDFETKGQPPRTVIERLQSKFKQQFAIDASADRTLREAQVFPDELTGLSAGTALAMLLRNYGLVFHPEKPRGQPTVYRIQPANGESAATRLGSPRAASDQPALSAGTPRPTEDDHAGKIINIRQKNWPIGWEPEKAPGATAPMLFDKINAEIDGFTLQESLDAIGPRLKVPYYVDRRMLAALGIDPANVKIKVERAQMSYMRLLDRVLAQARLGCQLRTDEAGTVFLWISR
jgi:hypothetical protein